MACRLADRIWTGPARSRRNLRPRRNAQLCFPAPADEALVSPRVPSEQDFEASVRERNPALNDAYKRLQAGGFADWRLSVDGLVDRPASFSLAQLKSYPSRSQITQLACEEGWSYIAEWIGVPLSHVLDAVAIRPQARYIVYFSIDPDWWDSIDMADALHPQTFLAYGMNGNELPVGNGGPLRIRLPRQLGYKSVKSLSPASSVTDSLKGFGKGSASANPEGGSYAWYAGI